MEQPGDICGGDSEIRELFDPDRPIIVQRFLPGRNGMCPASLANTVWSCSGVGTHVNRPRTRLASFRAHLLPQTATVWNGTYGSWVIQMRRSSTASLRATATMARFRVCLPPREAR